jgi:hypothetical protein
MSSETKTKYQVKNSKGEVIAPRCSLCGATVRVTKWGAAHKHYDKLSRKVGYCKGSGKAPVIEEETVETPAVVEETPAPHHHLQELRSNDLRDLRTICAPAREPITSALAALAAANKYSTDSAQVSYNYYKSFGLIIEDGETYSTDVTAEQVTAELIRRGDELETIDPALETDYPYFHIYAEERYVTSYNSLANANTHLRQFGEQGVSARREYHACLPEGKMQGKHNGAYVYSIPCNCPKCTAPKTVETPVVEELLVKGLPVETEEARVIRVTPLQVEELLELGYEVKSCKLLIYSSQVDELLERLYAARETHSRGARRIYTAIIEKVSGSKRSNSTTQAYFKAGDLNITYTSKSALAQLMQLIDTAERGELISKASASALRTSCTHLPPEVEARTGYTHLPPEVEARTGYTHLPPEVDECTTSEALTRFFSDE